MGRLAPQRRARAWTEGQPRLAVEQPGLADGSAAKREPFDGKRGAGGDRTSRGGGDRRQAKRRASRDARRRNRS